MRGRVKWRDEVGRVGTSAEEIRRFTRVDHGVLNDNGRQNWAVCLRICMDGTLAEAASRVRAASRRLPPLTVATHYHIHMLQNELYNMVQTETP